MLASYGGCKSWIELEVDVSTADAVPALDDAAFETKLAAFQTALGPIENHAGVI
jgi:hypothetical protein